MFEFHTRQDVLDAFCVTEAIEGQDETTQNAHLIQKLLEETIDPFLLLIEFTPSAMTLVNKRTSMRKVLAFPFSDDDLIEAVQDLE